MFLIWDNDIKNLIPFPIEDWGIPCLTEMIAKEKENSKRSTTEQNDSKATRAT